MPAAREDYLIRLIQQIASVLRRLRERLTNATASGAVTSRQDLAAIAREAGDAIGMLLGPQAGLLHHVDATSAVRMVGAADRVALWVELLEVQAAAARAEGDAARATQLTTHAAALARAAAAQWPADAEGGGA